MAKNNNLTDFLTNTANAIRTVDGTTAAINPQDFETRIKALKNPTGNIQLTQSSSTNVANYATATVRSASSYSMTGSAVTDVVTIGTLSSGYYPVSAKVKGTVSASTAGWFSSSGAVQAGTATQVGKIAAGTITNNTSGGTSSGTINRGSQIKIGAGYYASDTYYTAQSAETLSGDAAVGNVLSGKTFYGNSYTKQTGNMTNNGAVSKTLDTSTTSYTVPAGYHNGSGTVSITTQTKSASASGDITPDSGKVLSKVTVGSGSATPSATYATLSGAGTSATSVTSRYFKITPTASVGTAGWISSISNGTVQNYTVRGADGVALTTPNVRTALIGLATFGTATTITGLSGTVYPITSSYVEPLRVTTTTAGWFSSSSSAIGLMTPSNLSVGYVSQSSMATSTSSNSGTSVATITPTTSARYVNVSSGYHHQNRYVTVSGDSNLTAGNIKSGVSIFGVTGTYAGSGGGSNSAIATKLSSAYYRPLIESSTENLSGNSSSALRLFVFTENVSTETAGVSIKATQIDLYNATSIVTYSTDLLFVDGDDVSTSLTNFTGVSKLLIIEVATSNNGYDTVGADYMELGLGRGNSWDATFFILDHVGETNHQGEFYFTIIAIIDDNNKITYDVYGDY